MFYFALKPIKSCSEDPDILIPCSFDVPSGNGGRTKIICDPANQDKKTMNEELSGVDFATQKPEPFFINCPLMKCKVNLIDTPGIGDNRLVLIELIMFNEQ